MPKAIDPPPAFPLDHAEIAARRERVWRIARALPDTDVEEQNGHYLFLADGKRFGWLLFNHHGDGRLALNCKAARGANVELAAAHPDRYHLPAYVAHQGWLGLLLDQPTVAWGEVERALAEARSLAHAKGLSMPKSAKAANDASKAAAKRPASKKPAKSGAAKASAAKGAAAKAESAAKPARKGK
jgi:hypothetical protein